jgi:hypothetical protein
VTAGVGEVFDESWRDAVKMMVVTMRSGASWDGVGPSGRVRGLRGRRRLTDKDGHHVLLRNEMGQMTQMMHQVKGIRGIRKTGRGTY